MKAILLTGTCFWTPGCFNEAPDPGGDSGDATQTAGGTQSGTAGENPTGGGGTGTSGGPTTGASTSAGEDSTGGSTTTAGTSSTTSAGSTTSDPGTTDGSTGTGAVDPCAVSMDRDGDGYTAAECGGDDCDDDNIDVNPGAAELCDPLDVDEDCDPSTFGARDGDGDGLVDAACCNFDSTGSAACGQDCDDASEGFGVGDWAHCGGCGGSCGAREACVDGRCAPARRVFVTSSRYRGDFGGHIAGDSICVAAATGAGLGGEWKAMLKTAGRDFDDLENAPVPYYRLDGVRIADDWVDLRDQSILARVDVFETRASGGDATVWTGQLDPGDATASLSDHCDSWTLNSSPAGCCEGHYGAVGFYDHVDREWDGAQLYSCDASARLYCVEQ